MSKRSFSDEPNAPKLLKELSGKNAEKLNGGILERQKSYRELPQKPRGFQEAFLDALMNASREIILKIVTITNGLAKVTEKNITLGKLLARDNQHEVFEFPRDPDQVTQNLWYNIRKKLEITEDMDEGEVRERMTAFVVSSGMAQTNYDLINQRGTVSLDTLEKFSKDLELSLMNCWLPLDEGRLLIGTISPVPKENVKDYHIDIGKPYIH